MPARILQTTFITKQDALLAGIDTRQITAADKVKALDSALAQYSQDVPRLNVLDFAGTGDQYYLLSGAIVDIPDTDRDAAIDFTSSGADQQLAISFTLPRAMTLQAVRVMLKRTGSPAGTLAAQIRLASGALPSALIVATSNALTSASHLPVGFEAGKTEFTFTAITLQSGTYYLVLPPAGYTYADGTTEIVLGVDQSSVTNSVFTYNGTVWTAYGTDSAGVIEVIANLPNYEPWWSYVKGADIPAPVITSNAVPQTLEDEDFQFYRVGSNEWLYLPTRSPSSTETIRLSYSGRHLFSGSPAGVDIPAAHFEAVCSLSAYFVCTWLATRYGQNVDSGLNADISDRRSQSDVYASRAKEFYAQYESMLGIGAGVGGAGGAGSLAGVMKFGDMDRGTYSPRDFLYHPKRIR